MRRILSVLSEALGRPIVRGRRRTEGRAPMLALAGILLLLFAVETARERADAEPG